MDDLRARIAQRKRERRRKARIRLLVFAAIVAAIVLVVCFSCNNESSTPENDTNITNINVPSPSAGTEAAPAATDEAPSSQPLVVGE